MTFADDLYAYFVTNARALSLPTKITINNMPSDILDCLAVYDTGGYSANRYHGDYVDDAPTAQIRLRMRNSKSAHSVINGIYSALDDKTDITINNAIYPFIFATNPPTYLGETDSSSVGKAHEYTLNLYSRKTR